jgi:hypothetical protein
MEKAGRCDHVIGIPVSNRAFGIEEPEFPSKGATCHGNAKYSTANTRASGKSGRAGDKFAKGIKEHGEFLLQSVWIKQSLLAPVTNQTLNMSSFLQ